MHHILINVVELDVEYFDTCSTSCLPRYEIGLALDPWDLGRWGKDGPVDRREVRWESV